MIPGSYYIFIYLFIVSIVTLGLCYRYRLSSLGTDVSDNHRTAFCLASFFTLFIGLRPNDPVFADTVVYVDRYNLNRFIPYDFSLDVENVIYDNLFLYFASNNLGWHSLFVLFAGIYFIGTYIVCKKLFPKNTLLAFLVFLGAFSTFSYSVNGMKAGVAATIFLGALAYRTENPLWASILALTSWGFHHSMTPCVISFFIVWFYHNPKIYFLFWIGCLILSLAHVTLFQNLFMHYTTAKGATYLDLENMAGWDGKTGFRADFVLYSIMPIIVGYWSIFKKKIKNIQYDRILCTYLFTNGIWLLCMYAGFTNRIAYLSWFLYPFVLIYPILNKECNWGNYRYHTIAIVAALHLGFTLFMNILYL